MFQGLGNGCIVPVFDELVQFILAVADVFVLAVVEYKDGQGYVFALVEGTVVQEG